MPRRHIFLAALFGLAFLPPPAPAQKNDIPAKFADADVELIRDVVYGTGGSRPLKLHIIRPKKNPEQPMPVLVYIHGGGWVGGSRDAGIARSYHFAREGYFCASIEYRFSTEAPFPAQIEDCKCAIRFLRAKAKEYHLDPERIGVWGASAGGHLVSLLGTSADNKDLEGKGGWPDQSSRVQAVVNFCGPTDLSRIVASSKGATGFVDKLLGGPVSEKKNLAALASPVTHVTKDAPPFLIVHGDKDTLVPLDQAHVLADALKKAGVPVTLFVAEGQGHALTGPAIDRAVREFFAKTLKNPKK